MFSMPSLFSVRCTCPRKKRRACVPQPSLVDCLSSVSRSEQVKEHKYEHQMGGDGAMGRETSLSCETFYCPQSKTQQDCPYEPRKLSFSQQQPPQGAPPSYKSKPPWRLASSPRNAFFFSLVALPFPFPSRFPAHPNAHALQ